MLRVAGEGYILVEEQSREQVLKEIEELWDVIFEEARWGSIDQAMKLYAKLFERVDQVGRKVEQYSYGAEIVLPPRDLTVDELQDLLGKSER
ncbi:MAG: hypothetical protein ACFFCO_00570 [Promethearchaeota archaeon]